MLCFRSNSLFRRNFLLQQTGTDFTQTDSSTPSIISGTFLVISYNIAKYIVQPVLYTYWSNSNVKADVWVNYSKSYITIYDMLVPYNSRE